jgi:hypothetical protein
VPSSGAILLLDIVRCGDGRSTQISDGHDMDHDADDLHAVVELPDFIPRVLRLDDVSLLGADETVRDASVDDRQAGLFLQQAASQRGYRHHCDTVPALASNVSLVD